MGGTGRIAAPLVGVVIAVVLTACGGGVAVKTSPATTATNGSGVVLRTAHTPAGTIVVTGSGDTLYDFAIDTPDKSACISPTCVTAWPPLIVPATPHVGKGLDQSLAGTIKRPNGTLQATYGGHPLYRWVGDSQPGMVTGQALDNDGGYWYVIGPTGVPITTSFKVTG
jgi:predicted lipoprotein with Yx(FWY)xxD motif